MASGHALTLMRGATLGCHSVYQRVGSSENVHRSNFLNTDIVNARSMKQWMKEIPEVDFKPLWWIGVEQIFFFCVLLAMMCALFPSKWSTLWTQTSVNFCFSLFVILIVINPFLCCVIVLCSRSQCWAIGRDCGWGWFCHTVCIGVWWRRIAR